MNTVPCFKVNLPLKDERELNIRLNKNNGEWNYDDLANHFDVDDLLEWGFKDYELGFEKREDMDYDELWEGMPEYDNEDITPYRTLYVHFRNEKDAQDFAKLIGQKLTQDTKTIYHPVQIKEIFKDKHYVDAN
jgi:predicted transport protein